MGNRYRSRTLTTKGMRSSLHACLAPARHQILSRSDWAVSRPVDHYDRTVHVGCKWSGEEGQLPAMSSTIPTRRARVRRETGAFGL